MSDPGDGFVTLADRPGVGIVPAGVSTGTNVWSPAFTGMVDLSGGPFALDLGGALGSSLDTHPCWHIDSGIVGTNPGDAARWNVSLSLADADSTGDTESRVYTLTFAVPALGSALELGPVGVPVYRRRG